jgi:hypothetical protein
MRLGFTLGLKLRTEVGTSLGVKVGSSLAEVLGLPLGEALESWLGERLGRLLGLRLSPIVGSLLGLVVGDKLERLLGINDFAALGVELGCLLEANVGNILGDSEESCVGKALGLELWFTDCTILGANEGDMLEWSFISDDGSIPTLVILWSVLLVLWLEPGALSVETRLGTALGLELDGILVGNGELGIEGEELVCWVETALVGRFVDVEEALGVGFFVWSFKGKLILEGIEDESLVGFFDGRGDGFLVGKFVVFL